MGNNIAIYVYVALSIIAIGVLLGFLIHCENKSCSSYIPGMTGKQLRAYYNKPSCGARDMCLCSSGGRELCANRQKLLMTYEQGNTEYQDFAANQRAQGGPKWHNTNWMPGC